MLDTIPGPLRDRMEVIPLPGYTEEEKLQIAKKYLIKRQLERNGLTPEKLETTDEAIQSIIHDYTREAGVRNLEREIGAVARSAAVKIAEGNMTKSASTRRICWTSSDRLASKTKWRREPACLALPPALHGRRWAGISSSSRRAARRAMGS